MVPTHKAERTFILLECELDNISYNPLTSTRRIPRVMEQIISPINIDGSFLTQKLGGVSDEGMVLAER